MDFVEVFTHIPSSVRLIAIAHARLIAASQINDPVLRF
jgi:hypothetical protein